MFVVVLAQRPDVFPSLGALVGVLDVRGDGHRVLGPLDVEAVREICRIYAGDEVSEAPIESIARSSGGVPGQVHEVMSAWAREEATRRLEAAAQWLTTGRGQRSAGLGFANNVIGLKLDRIYRVPEAGEETVCPYKGLASYGEEDARFFFGRENLVGELAARSVGVGFLGVVGASGSGKSSVVAAGLRSSLAAGLLPGSANWRQVALRPGEHPMAELSSALARLAPGIDYEDPIGWATDALKPDERLVIYVDQFEEIFTTCTDQEEAATFVEALGRAAASPERAVVIVCLRGDFYAHTAEYPSLAGAISSNHVIVGPLSPEELRRAIELPARRAGLSVESALVDRLVEEVAEAPSGLPLLSTALVELWGQRIDGWIRLEAHETTGGLSGAVARLAEQTYGELRDEEKTAAPAVFLRLVGPGEGDGVTRRRVSLEEFDTGSNPSSAEVLRRFTQDRLLSADDRTVEVAHEALLREWPRLRTWLASDAQGRELRAHLTAAAHTWQDAGEEDSELYRGARLSATLDWTSTQDQHLNDLERSFLATSRQAGEREVERQRRSNRRLRGLLVSVALFLVVALVAGSLAIVQRGRAKAESLRADAARIGAQALTEPNLDRSMLMAVAGVRLADTPETRTNLFAALQRSPAAMRVIHPSGSYLASLAVSSDGNLLATVDGDGVLRFWSLGTWTQSGASIKIGGGINRRGMVFSADGRTLIAGAGPRLYSIDVQTRARRLLASWPSAWSVVDLALAPDGSRIAIGLLANPHPAIGFVLGRLLLIDATSGHVIWRRPYPYWPHTYDLWLGFSPRRPDRLVTSTDLFRVRAGGHTYVWDATTGQILRRYAVGGPLALSPDGRFAALAQNTDAYTVNPEAGMALLDLRTGAHRALQGGLNATFLTMAYTPDGASIVGGSNAPADDAIRVWDVRSGRIVHTFAGESAGQEALAVAPDGRTLLSGADDGSVVAWDLAGTQRLGKDFTWARLNEGCATSPCVAINRQGTLMAAMQGLQGSTNLVDLRTLKSNGTLPAEDGAGEALAFFPDGRTLVSGGTKGVSFWDVRTQQVVRTLRPPGEVKSVDLSPDGASLATLTANSTGFLRVQLWDVATWKMRRTYSVGGDTQYDYVAFSPDGRELAASGSTVKVWDLASGNELFSPQISDADAIAFSVDSQLLAVGTNDGQVVMLDARTGAPAGHPIHATGTIFQIAFSPDGRLVGLDSGDRTASLWDLGSRQRVGTFPSDLTTPVLQFLPNGQAVIVYEGHAAEWPLDLQSWERYACQVAGRDLTQDDWNQLLPGRPYEQVCPSTQT